MVENKDIVEVYKKRKYNEYLIEKRENIEKAKNEDPIFSCVEKAKQEIIKVCEENNVEITALVLPSNLTTDTLKKLDKIEQEFKDKLDDRDRIVEEVRAMETVCSTDEDFIKLYKKYGILDENGKIYDYK